MTYEECEEKIQEALRVIVTLQGEGSRIAKVRDMDRWLDEVLKDELS